MTFAVSVFTYSCDTPSPSQSKCGKRLAIGLLSLDMFLILTNLVIAALAISVIQCPTCCFALLSLAGFVALLDIAVASFAICQMKPDTNFLGSSS